jgi:hypothetical protein
MQLSSNRIRWWVVPCTHCTSPRVLHHATLLLIILMVMHGEVDIHPPCILYSMYYYLSSCAHHHMLLPASATLCTRYASLVVTHSGVRSVCCCTRGCIHSTTIWGTGIHPIGGILYPCMLCRSTHSVCVLCGHTGHHMLLCTLHSAPTMHDMHSLLLHHHLHAVRIHSPYPPIHLP